MPQKSQNVRLERIDESVRFKVLLEQLEDEAERLITDHVALGQKMGGVQGDLMDCLKSLKKDVILDETVLKHLDQMGESMEQVRRQVDRVGWDVLDQARKVGILRGGLVRLRERFKK